MTTSEQAALLAVRPSLANRSRSFNARSFAIVVSHPRLTCISDNYSNFSLLKMSFLHVARELSSAETNNSVPSPR